MSMKWAWFWLAAFVVFVMLMQVRPVINAVMACP